MISAPLVTPKRIAKNSGKQNCIVQQNSALKHMTLVEPMWKKTDQSSLILFGATSGARQVQYIY